MIPYGRQSINEDDILAVQKALSGEFITTGPLVQEFENEIARVTGTPSVTVSSGTAALHCAFAAIGIGPGDEVITPPITFVATQATAALLGAKIVFVDVLEDTANINPEAVEAAITSKTKAIVAVDFAGHPADLNELREISNKYGIYLVEDAAHSLGSEYRDKQVGSIADITAFSFFPTKNITSGEGGAVCSENSELLDRARKFSRQGLIREELKFKNYSEGPWHQEVQNFGLNYRMPDILCALGISQIQRIFKFKELKRKIFTKYVSGLSDLDWITLPVEREYVNANWHLFPIRVPPARRKDLFVDLHNHGIRVQVNYIPAYRHPVFQLKESDFMKFPVSEKFYKSEISLPMYADLSETDIDRVLAVLNKFSI